MTQEQKIQYLRVAAGVCGFGFTTEQLDLLVSLYELVIEKEGRADVESMVDIEYEVKQRANAKARSQLLDKVSEKK